MKSWLVASAMLALSAVAPAFAQGDGSIDYRRAVSGYNTNEILALARSRGYVASAERLQDGGEVLKFASSDIVFFAQRTVCNERTCTGLALYAQYNPGFDVPLTTINEYNSKQAIIVAAKVNNSAVLKRYMIADFGTYIGNIASDLHNFDLRAKDFVQYVSGGSKSVSNSINEPAFSPKVNVAIAGSEPLDEEFHLRMRAEFENAAQAPIN